jgi:hypothetical protein
MAVDPRTGRQVHGETHLYATGQEAAERFEAVMEDPVVLRGFIKRIRWGKSAFPTAFGPAFSIEVPVLEDFYGEERWQAQLLASLLQLARCGAHRRERWGSSSRVERAPSAWGES